MEQKNFAPIIFPLTIIGSEFVEKVLPLVEEAKHTIDIIVFDWRLPVDAHPNPVAELLFALQKAVTRGVAVRVLVSNEAVGARLKKYGFEVQHLYTPKLMHCKLMLLDKVVAVIGSHNYTISAFTQNLEVSVAVHLKYAENDVALYFRNLWGI